MFSDGGAGAWDVVARSNLSGLVGTVAYKREKGAAGQYAVYNPEGSSEVGSFTADAMLTATFGDTDSADNTQYVSGEIGNFATMSGGEATETGADWTVALGKSGSGAASSTDFVGSTTWSVGDDKAAERGTYTARLFSDEGAGTLPSALTESPDEIGGTFKAQFGSHQMLGAFAATLSTADDPATE